MPAFWSVDPTMTAPASVTTTAQEDITLALDATALLVNGGAPTAPEGKLYRIVDNGADTEVTLADAAALGSGNTINQRLRGLVADTTYRLRISFATGGGRRAMTVVVICVE